MAFMLHNFGVKPMIMLFILNVLLKPRFLVSQYLFSICRKGKVYGSLLQMEKKRLPETEGEGAMSSENSSRNSPPETLPLLK